MGTRDYGGNTKHLDAENKAYEEVVFQQDKPLSSSEQVLLQEIRQSEEAEKKTYSSPSGFLTGGFLEDGLRDYSFGNTADQFKLVNKPRVHVNGWVIPLEYTNTTNSGENHIQLDAPPTNSGEYGVDFVFLEVWRQLIKPDPSTTMKPASDKVYPHGNIKAPSGTWLNDEMKDNPISVAAGIETSFRVQIQHRIRSVRLSDDSDRIGYTDGNVSALNPDGSSPGNTQNYTQDSDDPGLWVAGTGDPTTSNNVDTVDGYMYSIPICLVYRRNSDGFDFKKNGIGGKLLSNAPSDRPDGYFADQVVEEDIQDLRHAARPKGWNYEEVMEQNMSLLHDLNLKSWAAKSAHQEWYVGGTNGALGNQYLKADDIIPEEQDRSSGNTIRGADRICRVFSDESHVEEFFRSYSTNSSWSNGDAVSIDFGGGGMDVKKHQPPGTVITDVVSVKINDEDGTVSVPDIPVQKVTGLGTDSATLTIGTPPFSNQTSADLWVEWEVTYPAGEGTTSDVTTQLSNYEVTPHNPSAFNGPEFSTIWTDDDDPNTGRPAFRNQLTTDFEDGPHREVELQYHTENDRSLTTYIINNSDQFLLDEYAYNPPGNMTVTVNNTAVTVSSVDGRLVTIQDNTNKGDTVDVQWIPQKPIPDNGSEFTVFYRSAGVQAIPFEHLPDPLDLEIQYVSDQVYTSNIGSGSPGSGYPWESPTDHVPVTEQASYNGSGEMNSFPDISIDDFGIDSGILQLDSMVPMADVSSVTLKNSVNTTPPPTGGVDYYKDVTTSSGYVPSVFAQELSSIRAHFAYFPFLARVQQDTNFAPKGTMVLVVMAQYFDDQDPNATENKVLGNDPNTGTAVYKLKGDPIIR